MSHHGSKSAFFVARASNVQSHSAIIFTLQAKREKLLKVLVSHNNCIDRLHAQIAYLQEKIKRVPFTDKHKEILSWIQGKEAKIEEVQKAVIRVQTQLEELDSKILYYLKN